MNPLFTLLERMAAGPVPGPLDSPVLDFRNGRILQKRALMEAILIMGSIGKGKTTLAKTILSGMLKHGFGGLVLVVKGSQIRDIQELCRLAGREKDCLILAPGAGHVFNPIQDSTDIAEATDLLVELSEILSPSSGKGENESFWREQLVIILKNLLALCHAVHGRFDLVLAAELFDGRPASLSAVSDPVWQQRSPLAKAIASVGNRMDEIMIRLAVEYFTKTYPLHGARLQGSLSAVVSGIFDRLRRPPLSDLFTGESTFSMEDVLNGGKIVVVGMPALDSIDGRIANGLMQFVFCRKAPRIARRNNAFLVSDECQETITREIMRKVAILREFRVATILLTQNLAVLDDKIGQTAREGLCGLMTTKIFCTQSESATRQWAAEQIGKIKTPVETRTKGRSSGKHGQGSNTGFSTHEVWDYRVPPSRFAELEVGETICLRDGDVWLACWHKESPGKSGTVRVL